MEFYDRSAQLACTIGRQWAPYGLEAVVFGAIVTHVSGDWPLAAKLVDLTGLSPPELADALLTSVALEIAAGRGDISALASLPRVRNSWHLDGLVVITSAGAAIELLGQTGDVDAALAIHDDAVALVRAMWQHMAFQAQVRLAALLLGQLATAAAIATTARRVDLVRRGDELAAKALAVAAEGRHTGPEGAAWTHRVIAEQGRLHWLSGIDPLTEDALIERWRAAITGFERFGHVHETARSRTRLAAVLYAAGHPAEAETEADLARAVATSLGAQPLLDELCALSGSGAPSGRPTKTRGGESLTIRELEVLTLVETGRSNREIGQQLFISAKTVSVHISNVMAKLDASSRTEAVAVARREHLID
jgi:DNA-binding CsgD family transcriptional regulator